MDKITNNSVNNVKTFPWKIIIIVFFVILIVTISATIGIIFYIEKLKESKDKGPILTFTIVNGGKQYFPGNSGYFEGGNGNFSSYEILNVNKTGSISKAKDIKLLGNGKKYIVGDVLYLTDNGNKKASVRVESIITDKIAKEKEKEAKEKEAKEKEATAENNSSTPYNSTTLDPLASLNNSTTPVNSSISMNPLVKNEVFSTNNKLWTYDQAPYVCKKLGSELATYDQLVNAAKTGANWCNIGWFKKGVVENEKGEKILANAAFPVQKNYYKKTGNQCGPKLNPLFEKEDYSVQNVGLYDNYKFAVNCYGDKRDATEAELALLNKSNNNSNTAISETIDFSGINSVEPNIGLLPYNKSDKRWNK